MKKVEALFDCPKFNRESLALSGTTTLQASNLKMSVSKKSSSSDIYSVKIESEEANNLHLDLEFNYNEGPSQIWTTPLTNDLRTYFATMKKPVSLNGEYSLSGSKHNC